MNDTAIIPAEMRILPHWVVHRDKVPFCPVTGKAASCNDPATWSDYDTARSKVNGYYQGIGFQAGVEAAGIVMIDLDHCLIDGEPSPLARKICAAVQSYCEVSPSGTGLHLFFGGKLPGPSIKTQKAEIYDHARYFTVTGNADPEHNHPFRTLTTAEIKTVYDLIAATRETATTGSTPQTAGVLPATLGKGDRHPELFSVAGSMRRRGCDEPEIFAALSEINKRCDPPLPEKEIQKLAAGVLRYEPSPDFRPSETWVAEQFASQYGNDWRFDHTRRAWLNYNGRVWELDEKMSVLQVVADVARKIKQLAVETTDGDLAKKILSFAIACESKRKMLDVLTIAGTIPRLAVTQAALDSNHQFFNCLNGTLDLETFTFQKHDRNDLLTKIGGARYDPGATCPRFLEFIQWISCDDSGMVRHLQQFFGICLTGEVLQYLWFWHGGGSNGKTVLENIAHELLGDYSMKSPFDMLTEKNGSIPNDVARLVGSRLVVCSEIPGGSILNESLAKALTGGDRIAARFLHREFFEFVTTHKLVIVGNNRPRIKGGDNGIWRRLRLIPFENIVAEHNRRPMAELLSTFREELPGILNWSIDGLKDYRANGLHIFERSKIASEEYRDSEDVLGEFLSSTLREPNASASGRELFAKYQSDASGRTLSQRAFYEALRERGYVAKKTMIGIVFDGIGLPVREF